MRDLIASVESSKDGYNATLDNGRWTGGSQNLTSMTLNEILALQKQMLANPENRALYGDGLGSSALGRYQIVSKTLRGLIKEMGLSGNELFDQGMQDAMADRLLARRGGNLVGLRQEWAGLKNVPDHVIQAALQGSQGINANAGTLPALPSLVSDRQARTEELRTQAEEVRKQEEANRELEFQLARKKELERLMAEKSGSSIALDEGAGKNFSSVVEKIQTGRLGGSRDINAAEYAEILKIAKELDETDKRMAERKKAERQSTEQLKTLEEQRADIATRIAEEQERVKDPNYVGQSNELRRLIEDLDQYVDRVRTAYGADSAAYAEAQRYRKQLIGQQKALDATQRQAGIANEVRDIQEGLMTQNQLRLTQMKRDLARIDDWVAAARAAGLSEVEIVRQAEEAKEAIRAKYGAEMNPVMQQMEEWKDFSGNMMQEATNWTGTLSSGVTSLITGTGDLRSVFGGLVNDMLSAVVSNQFNFLFSSMAGGKAASGAAAAGSKGSKAAGGAKMAAPIRHTGGMANYRGARRMVSASTFANAPRFHTGGIAGAPKLKPNEVPIIAEKDEGIFTKEQMASLAPVGTGGMGPVTINAPVTVSGSSGTAQQNADLAERMAKEMESTMRGVVVDELRKQGRPGNMMNNRRQGAR
jgi:X-X-X-Leu-X-X-Gly heptad repeat protein